MQNEVQSNVYDVVIIGAGTAGQSAYNQVSKQTDNVLVINAGPWDTTCARVGCMPSKLLIAAAKQAHVSQTAPEFGILHHTTIDPKAVMQRVQTLRDYFTGHAQQQVDQWPEHHKKQGKAAFIDATTLTVGAEVIHTKATVIATGSTPRIPDGWQTALKDKLLTSDTIFNLPQLPDSLIVAGAGAIGIELAQALSWLGVKVSLINTRDQIGGLTSPELRQQATELLTKDMRHICNATIEQVYLEQDQVMLHYHTKASSNMMGQSLQHSEQLCADYLLVAIGRESHLDDLKLEHIDNKFTDSTSIQQHEKTMQLDHLPVFLAGDVASQHALQHEANYAGRIAGINAVKYPNIENFEPYTGLSIVFSNPQMAIIGQSFQALTEANIAFICSEVSYQSQGRATVEAKNQGAIQLYGCPDTYKLLGAELLIHDAEHIAHLLAWMIQQDVTIDGLLAMPFYHPVLEEGIRTALIRLRLQIKRAALDNSH